MTRSGFDEVYRLRDVLLSLSHSARTPLSTVRNVIEEARELSALSGEALEDADTAIAQFLTLLTECSDAGQIQNEEFRQESLGTLIEQMGQTGGFAEASYDLEFEFDDQDASVLLHPSGLRHTVKTLVDLCSRRSSRESSQLRLQTFVADEQVILRIEELGKGAEAPTETLSLQDFLQKRHGVSTLGLSIAQALLSAHGGEVELQMNRENILALNLALPKSL